jgi:hypothetical protein
MNTMNVSAINIFYYTSTRDKNDAANTERENILISIINDPIPQEYLDDAEYGSLWTTLYNEWNDVLKRVAQETGVNYTSIKIKKRAGRKFKYDFDVLYYNGTTPVANRKIEFKNGGTNISNIPQFLSLQAKVNLFPVTYDTFWYNKYMDKYIACDSGITEPKPSLEKYIKNVTKTNYNTSPFFAQLREREEFFKKEKNDVVNDSITDYLTTHGEEFDIKSFSETVKATQTDKIYLLWSNGKFHIDKFSQAEMSGMIYHSIKNGNVLEIKSGNTIYGLLLRWRNHKGILNPAWQISIKRE